MTLNDVYDFLKEGKCLTRDIWADGMYIFIKKGEIFETDKTRTHDAFNISLEFYNKSITPCFTKPPSLCLVLAVDEERDYLYTDYHIDAEDFLADDWKIYNYE